MADPVLQESSSAGPASASSLDSTINLHRLAVVDCTPTVSTPGVYDALRMTSAIFLNHSSHTAFFKFRTRVDLLVPPAGRQAFEIFLIVPPESIESLSYDRQPQLPEKFAPTYKKLSGIEVLRITFTFTSTASASLVVPDVGALLPATRHDASVLATLQLLASATRHHLTIYLPGESLDEAHSSLLCTTASSGELRTSPAHNDTKNLYRKCGAKVVSVAELGTIVMPESPTASPPSYGELDSPAPEHSSSAQFPQKRRRTVSPRADDQQQSHRISNLQDQAHALENRLKDKTNALTALLQDLDAKETRLRSLVEQADAKIQKLAAVPDVANSGQNPEDRITEEWKAYLDDRLSEFRDSIFHDVRFEEKEAFDIRIAELREDLVEEISEAMRDYVHEQIDEREVDLVTTYEMDDVVDDRIQAAEERLRDLLQGEGVRIFLPDV